MNVYMILIVLVCVHHSVITMHVLIAESMHLCIYDIISVSVNRRINNYVCIYDSIIASVYWM